MLVKRRRGWEIPESQATGEAVYWRRRDLARLIAAGPILLATGGCVEACGRRGAAGHSPPTSIRPSATTRYALDRPLTDETLATTYNNFYEFGSHKQIAKCGAGARA